MIKVAVLGYGTVGRGVVEVIDKNKAMVNKKAGDELKIAYILDLLDFPGDPHEKEVVHDINVILEDPEVKIICETMGGVGAAYKFTKQALEMGKSVCTSNKELVAKYGPELLETAATHSCNYLFEASVGGGIPIIRPLNYSLTAENIEGITGILNGTTNYILTKMENEGAAFKEVLKKAQELGYAERDPEADVEGHDACRKIAILASLMMGKMVDSEKIHTEGITGIKPEDFKYAKASGRTIKLLAMAKAIDDKTVEAMVAPAMISRENPLAMVNDVFNAVLVTGNMLGDSMYYGKGAGKLPTASAVVSDVIDCARHKDKKIMCFWDKEEAVIADPKKSMSEFYIRAKTGCEAALEEAFPNGSIMTIPGRQQDFAFFTEAVKEEDFAKICESLGENVLSTLRLR